MRARVRVAGVRVTPDHVNAVFEAGGAALLCLLVSADSTAMACIAAAQLILYFSIGAATYARQHYERKLKELE